MLLLLFAAIAGDVIYYDIGLKRETSRYAAIISRFFVNDGVVAKVEAKAAIFNGRSGAQHANFASLGPDGFWDDAVFLPLLCVGGDFLLQEQAH